MCFDFFFFVVGLLLLFFVRYFFSRSVALLVIGCIVGADMRAVLISTLASDRSPVYYLGPAC